MKKKMKNRKRDVLLSTPFLLALGSVCFQSLWLVPATVILIFLVVALLPCCHRRENLWLFILCAVCGVPINIFLLTEYPLWRYLLCGGSEEGVIYYLTFAEMILMAAGVEEVVISLVGRKLWRRQYALSIPETEEKRR